MHFERDSTGLVTEANWIDFCKEFDTQFVSAHPIQSGNMKESYRIVTSKGVYLAQRYKYGNFFNDKFEVIREIANILNSISDGIAYPKFICSNKKQWFVGGFNFQKYIINDDPIINYTSAKMCAQTLKRFHESCNSISEIFDIKKLPIKQNQEIKSIYNSALLYGTGIVHGEFRLRNLLFHNNSPVAIIDLDSICYAQRYIDVGYLMLDFIERDISNYNYYISAIHKAYSFEIPIQAGYAAIALILDDYIDKCNSGYLQNNRVLSIEQYSELLRKIILRCA